MALKNFRTLIASMQNDAVSWLYTEIPKTFQPQKNAFMTALHRVRSLFISTIKIIDKSLLIRLWLIGWACSNQNLFLQVILKDAANDLITKDGWPPDQEKALFGRLVLDVPVS